MTLTCTNCYQEEEGSHHDVDFQTGGYLCSGCKERGTDSAEAMARREQNRDGALGRAIPFIKNLRRQWSKDKGRTGV